MCTGCIVAPRLQTRSLWGLSLAASLSEFGFLSPPMVLLGHFPTLQSNWSLGEVNAFEQEPERCPAEKQPVEMRLRQ